MPRGPINAYHVMVWNPGRVSATSGRSGTAGERFVPPSAIARSLPAFTKGRMTGMLLNMNCTWPPTTSLIAGPVPLYGT